MDELQRVLAELHGYIKAEPDRKPPGDWVTDDEKFDILERRIDALQHVAATLLLVVERLVDERT